MVQSILASLPCASSHLETDKYRIWEGAGEVSRLLNLTCVEQDAGFVSFVVVKYQVTQQSKRRLYLELLLEPGSNPWYVVVVVIFIYIYKKKSKMSGGLYTRIILSRQYFYRLIIVCRRWCFSAHKLAETEPSTEGSFRQNFKINHIRLGGKYLNVFYNPIIYTIYIYHQTRPAVFIAFVFLGQHLNGSAIHDV